MFADHRILVTGATGNTGSMVLQELATRGARVRAMDREQPGGGRLRDTSAEMVVGNFEGATGAIRREGCGRWRQASREALTASDKTSPQRMRGELGPVNGDVVADDIVFLGDPSCGH